MIEAIEVVARDTHGSGVAVLHDFREVPVYALQESPTNPRRSFDETKLHELAQSIRSHGVLVPLIVRELDLDRFEIVAGARRFRAALLAEISTVPVRIVRLSDTQVLEYQLIENAIREDVHPYEEAMAYKALLETSEPRYDVASIAAKTGRSITHIYQRLRLADLIADAAAAFQANQITAGLAVLIAKLPQDQQQTRLPRLSATTTGRRKSTRSPFGNRRTGYARISCSRSPTRFSMLRMRNLCRLLGPVQHARNAPERILRYSTTSLKMTAAWTPSASKQRWTHISPEKRKTLRG